MNRGYQIADQRAFDYSLWRLPGSSVDLRGPCSVDLASAYFVALGAAQTFGRFVPKPYVSLLEDHLAIPGVNLGISGAGPSFFLRNNDFLEVLNNAKFVIIQVMSGRSVENSEFELGANQGVLRQRKGAGNFVFAESAYQKLLIEADIETLIRVRTETRSRYINEMISLLQMIKRPKTLLWFSTRSPEYSENLLEIGGYLGCFPHFVNRSVVDQIAPFADSYVEVVSRRGLPQPIFDLETKKPSLVWPADLFPNVKLRYHNNYYPSPEMHEDVAVRLAGTDLTKTGIRRDKSRRTAYVCHRRVFGNAGDFIENVLRGGFRKQWCNLDDALEKKEPDKEIFNFLDQSNFKAFSTHRNVVPRFDDRLVINLVVFLQHPVLRVRTIYEIERSPSRRLFSNLPHTAKARALSFKDYVGWILSGEDALFPFSNYQTRLLSLRSSSEDQSFDQSDVCETHLDRALQLVRYLRIVGVCEEMEASCAAFDEWLCPVFPEISFSKSLSRSVMVLGKELVDEKMADIKDQIGSEYFGKIIHANNLDLVLYEFAKCQLRSVTAGIKSVAVS